VSYALLSKEQKDIKPHWERLLEHDKKIKHLIDQKFIEKKLVEFEKETEGWTFEPKFYTKDYHPKTQLNGTIYERTNVWKLQKDIKIGMKNSRIN